MPLWTATSREPGHIPVKPTILEEGRSNAKVRAQVEVAHAAVKKMVSVVGERSNVSMSGFAATKKDNVPDQIHIEVVEVKEP